MTVETRLAEIRAEIDALRVTPCSGCGHWYMSHDPMFRRCNSDSVRSPRCKCRKFVDPEESLFAPSEILEVGETK